MTKMYSIALSLLYVFDEKLTEALLLINKCFLIILKLIQRKWCKNEILLCSLDVRKPICVRLYIYAPTFNSKFLHCVTHSISCHDLLT